LTATKGGMSNLGYIKTAALETTKLSMKLINGSQHKYKSIQEGHGYILLLLFALQQEQDKIYFCKYLRNPKLTIDYTSYDKCPIMIYIHVNHDSCLLVSRDIFIKCRLNKVHSKYYPLQTEVKVSICPMTLIFVRVKSNLLLLPI